MGGQSMGGNRNPGMVAPAPPPGLANKLSDMSIAELEALQASLMRAPTGVPAKPSPRSMYAAAAASQGQGADDESFMRRHGGGDGGVVAPPFTSKYVTNAGGGAVGGAGAAGGIDASINGGTGGGFVRRYGVGASNS